MKHYHPFYLYVLLPFLLCCAEQKEETIVNHLPDHVHFILDLSLDRKLNISSTKPIGNNIWKLVHKTEYLEDNTMRISILDAKKTMSGLDSHSELSEVNVNIPAKINHLILGFKNEEYHYQIEESIESLKLHPINQRFQANAKNKLKYPFNSFALIVSTNYEDVKVKMELERLISKHRILRHEYLDPYRENFTPAYKSHSGLYVNNEPVVYVNHTEEKYKAMKTDLINWLKDNVVEPSRCYVVLQRGCCRTDDLIKAAFPT